MPALLRGSRDLTLATIAELTCSRFLGEARADRRISSIATLDTAGSADIVFVDDEKHLGELAATHAGACLLAPRLAASAPRGVAVLLNEEPYRAFVTVAQALFPHDTPFSLFETGGRAAGAQVHTSSRIEAGVTVDPLAMIGPRAEVGAGTVIAAGAALGPDVCVGRQCRIGAGATVLHALIGDRVIVHPGARIGHDGLGYVPDRKGYGRIPQFRRVIIQDDAQIGANTTIDRGSTRDTVIGEGTKIDNLVQIAHNVAVGRHCLIAAQADIGSNVRLGDFVIIGRQTGIADDVAIGDGVALSGQSRVEADLPSGWHSGSPSAPSPRGAA
jgi:UDP-3-O-[3-hydroxymyristoyl] glucosamine N-acyltransferase